MSDGDTPETSALRESVRRFTKSEIARYLAQWEDALELPRELHQKAADAGLLGVGFSEDVGREGGSRVDSSVVSEAIMKAGDPTSPISRPVSDVMARISSSTPSGPSSPRPRAPTGSSMS